MIPKARTVVAFQEADLFFNPNRINMAVYSFNPATSRTSCALPLVMQEIELDAPIIPCATLDKADMQELFNSLYRMGFRPAKRVMPRSVTLT